MAIPALEIAMSMRYALGDMQGVNISDHELLEPINQAVNRLYSELGQRHVREAMKIAGPVRINTNSSTKTNVSISESGPSATSDTDEEEEPKTYVVLDIDEYSEASDGASAAEATEYQYYTLPETFVRIHQVLGVMGLFTSATKPGWSQYKVIIPTTGMSLIKGTYRLAGRIMRMPTGWYYVQYYYIPAKVKNLAGNIDAPESMRGWIEKLSVAMYKNDYNTMQVLLRQAENTFAGREIPRFENTEPAQTLGRTTVAE